MNPRRAVIPAALLALGLVGAPGLACATARQLHLGPAIGASWTSGPQGGVNGVVSLHGAYDLTDAWRLYANLQYALGAGDAANTPRHEASLSAGVAYVIDILSVLPWIGLGVNGTLVATPVPGQVFVVPVAEARGGVDYLASRYFGLTFQFSYGFVLTNRGQVADMFSGLIGLRWTLDL